MTVGARGYSWVLVTGSCPGAGKTTFCTRLASQLNLTGVQTMLYSEGDLLRLAPFARFDAAIFREDRGAIQTLLDGCREVFGNGRDDGAVSITDALLPGWFWLLGRYPGGQVERFTDELANVLAPHRTLIVYLAGEIDVLFARAVAERGEEWSRRFIDAIARWRVPYYPGSRIADFHDALEFFAWLDERSRRLLDDWPGDHVILDAGTTATDDLIAMACPAVETGPAPGSSSSGTSQPSTFLRPDE